MTVKGIEVSGTVYDNEDETARNTASTASSVATQASEDVSTLQTTVNNISDSVDTISDDLQTVEDNIGDLADLETTAKTNLVSAVNEINANALGATSKSLTISSICQESSSSFTGNNGTDRYYKNSDNFPFSDFSALELRIKGGKVIQILAGGSGSYTAMASVYTILWSIEITHTNFLANIGTEKQWEAFTKSRSIFGGTLNIRNAIILTDVTITYSSGYDSVVLVGRTGLTEALTAGGGGGGGSIPFNLR